MATFDTDTIFDDKPIHGGEYGLWLRVTTLAVVQYLTYRSDAAQQFIFDESNPFFDFVSTELGYDPGGLRTRIRMALARRLTTLVQARRSATRTGEDMAGEYILT